MSAPLRKLAPIKTWNGKPGPQKLIVFFVRLLSTHIHTYTPTKMASTTLYAIIAKSLELPLHISLTPLNVDGHDLRSVATIQELTVPYDIKENDRVIVVSKKDNSRVCSVVPYSTQNDLSCVVKDDEMAYTINVPLNSWYGVR